MMKKLLLVMVLMVAPAWAWSAAAHADGLTLLSSTPIDERLTELTFRSPSLAEPVKVRVLVPREAASRPDARYPALYLLHGSDGNASYWTDLGAEALTEGMGLVVVMPDGGSEGWYTNWPAGKRPRWEDFHVGELVAWIDAHQPVIADRAKRAIGGLSMGGFGAMSYAARHPDLFSWAGSFSGAVDIVNYPPVVAIIDLEAPVDGGLPGDQFGDRLLAEANWRAHNPWDLAGNLRNTTLVIDTGNGQPGPLDPSGKLFDPIELGVHDMSVLFHQRLLALGISHTWNDYGPGTHSWPYWQRDLSEAMPSVMSTFRSSRHGKSRKKHRHRHQLAG
jgi:S-formylglutathione hydrolase FrmB